MIFGRDRCAEQDHDAVAHAPDDHAAEPRHGLGDDADHGTQGGLASSASILEISSVEPQMSAKRTVTCFCWAPEMSGPPRSAALFPQRLESSAATGAERASAGLWRNRMTYLLDFRATPIAVLPLQRALSTAEAGYEHLSSGTGSGSSPKSCPTRLATTGKLRLGRRWLLVGLGLLPIRLIGLVVVGALGLSPRACSRCSATS